jgi:hypothetical protein
MVASGTTNEEAKSLAAKHATLTQTIQELTDLETSMYQNLQNLVDQNATSNITEKVKSLTDSRIDLYNQLKAMYDTKIDDVTESKYAVADKLAINKTLQQELTNIDKQINHLTEESNTKKKLIKITDYEYDRYSEFKNILKTLVYGLLVILASTFLMKQPWFPKVIGITIIGITIAYVFVLTIGRIVDNTQRDDRNYAKFTQTHDNSKWNEEQTADKKAKKADSLTDHLFGAPKCESFSSIGPMPYEPVLDNVRTVRS